MNVFKPQKYKDFGSAGRKGEGFKRGQNQTPRLKPNLVEDLCLDRCAPYRRSGRIGPADQGAAALLAESL